MERSDDTSFTGLDGDRVTQRNTTSGEPHSEAGENTSSDEEGRSIATPAGLYNSTGATCSSSEMTDPNEATAEANEGPPEQGIPESDEGEKLHSELHALSVEEDSIKTDTVKQDKSDDSSQEDQLKIGETASSTESFSEYEEAGASSDSMKSSKQAAQSVYHIKWVKWKGINTAVITQNENGPCPLLAIINVLLLQRRIQIPAMQQIITTSQLMEYIGDCILTEAPEMLPEGAQLNYEQNMHDAIAIMGKLQTGLDVNVKFTGVTEFEYTPECVVFDLLSIRLLHGWVVDPQNREAVSAITSLGYNQLVEKVIASKQEGLDSQLVSEGMIAEAFLDQSATQLTFHGLCELNSYMKNDDLYVFFRNNHFSTLYKFKDELFLLVTDQGYLTEERIVWETLSSVDGDGCFVDAEFKTLPTVTQTAPSPRSLASTARTISQEDQDYLVALTLQEEQEQSIQGAQTHAPAEDLSPSQPPTNQGPQQERPQSDQEWNDLQLAMQLQREENRRQPSQEQQQQQQQQQQPRGMVSQRAHRHYRPVNNSPTQQAQTTNNERCMIL